MLRSALIKLSVTVIILLTCFQMAYSQSWPLKVDNVLTSPFGPRNLAGQNDDNYPHPWDGTSFFGYYYDFHRGLDMDGKNDSFADVHAIQGGKLVSRVAVDPGENLALISHKKKHQIPYLIGRQ